MLLLLGCSAEIKKELTDQLAEQLNSSIGKLTSTDVLMFASSPSEKNVINDGEIWIYKYRKSKNTYTTTGTGGFLLPYQTEEKTDDYHYDIRLRFNKKGILTQWTADGDLVRYDSRDSGITPQEIPFFSHH
jgi:hypothetical protein